MNLELVIYDCLCAIDIFKINGIEADYDDFGNKADQDPCSAGDHCCGDMQFIGKAATHEVLGKYSITQAEYDAIVSELAEKLSFGSCGWCS